MTLLIVGLSLSFIAIGVLYYLKKELSKRLERNNKALLALQEEFTQYQVKEKRFHEKETAKKEIRFDNIARSIKKNEDAINSINKRIPDEVKKCIKHIELSR